MKTFNFELLDNIERLPTLPTTATQLLELLATDTKSLQAVSELMENDPSITAEVLKISNSAFYGLRKEVDTVSRALVVLGVNEIVNIILSLSLFKTFPTSIGTEFDLKVFWKHSLVVAYLSRLFARIFNIRTHGEEFTAGLMHDIGLIVLNQYFNNEFQETVYNMIQEEMPSYRAEQKVFKTDHAAIGYWLSSKWNLPGSITEAIRFHHSPELSPNNQLPALINLADEFTNSRAFHQDYLSSFGNPYENQVWSLLGIDPDKIDREKLELNIDEEIDKAAQFVKTML